MCKGRNVAYQVSPYVKNVSFQSFIAPVFIFSNNNNSPYNNTYSFDDCQRRPHVKKKICRRDKEQGSDISAAGHLTLILLVQKLIFHYENSN